MRNTIISLLLLCGAVAGADDTTGRLRASAEPVRFDLAPLAAGTRFIVPPALTVEFSIEATCETAADAQSLSLSIADTQLLLGPAELTAQGPVRLELPAGQLAPLRVDGFCRLDDDDADSGEKLIEDAYTARVSLRCTAGETQSIVYTTLPVDLRIQCDNGKTESAGTDLEAD